MSHSIAEHVRLVRSVGARGANRAQGLVSRSWLRCLNEYGLDPARKPAAYLVEPSDLNSRIDSLSRIIDSAKLEMTNLYQQLADTQTLVVLTDADGVVLNVVGDPHFARDAASQGLSEGAVWSEQKQGTNGMGTCLMEAAPVVIHRDQHFLACNVDLTCSAAPITDSQGKLMAVLDVSSRSQMLQQHSLVLVRMSARMIENRALLAHHRDDYVVRFHSRPEFVHTLEEGLLALSGEGRLLAANRSAMFQLGFSSFTEAMGCSVDSVLNSTLNDLVARSASASFHPVPVYSARQGSRFFAVAQAPERLTRQSGPARERPAQVPADQVRARAFRELEFGDPRMAHNIRCVERVLNRDISILLFGETGAGKDVFAKAIHTASARASGPYVAVNCASLPESLIESELFGYRSGAFTGASREGRRGKICQANGGTLFLDEIGDMPLTLQARLLRVLEEREVVPLGGEAPIRVDIQLISATHRDLREMIKKGEFRQDLYFRLEGIMLSLPPLRERADRRRLIQHTLAQEAGGKCPCALSPEALAMLERYEWPGNLRQLRNVLRAAVALCDGDAILPRDLPTDIQRRGDDAPRVASAGRTSRLNPLESAERDALLKALERHHWNISSLAQELKTSRNTVYRKMKRLGIRSEAGGCGQD